MILILWMFLDFERSEGASGFTIRLIFFSVSNFTTGRLDSIGTRGKKIASSYFKRGGGLISRFLGKNVILVILHNITKQIFYRYIKLICVALLM